MILKEKAVTIKVVGTEGKYKIKKDNENYFYCTCPAWCFQKLPIHERTCKHIQTFMSRLMEDLKI